jgi:tRNA-dihydrouridine synthase B
MAPGAGDGPRPSGVPGAASGAPPPLSVPFSIGQVEVPNRVVLAPMAGLTTSAYRRHLKTHGAGLVTTEMVSAYGLCHRNKRTGDYLTFQPEERPIAVQLFGDTPEVMASAAELVLTRDPARGGLIPDVLDINMGCPVRKVMRTGAGAALLADHDRAVAVAAAAVRVADGSRVPVTVKLRSGLRDGDSTAIELAARLEQVGVAALGVHPRAANQHYHGKADHAITAEIVRKVDIPVVASGDVTSPEAAAAILGTTGAAAVMVARGAAGDPWLLDALLTGEAGVRPPLPEVVADLRALLARVIEEMGPQRAVKWMWRVVGWYLRPSRVPPAVIERLRAARDGFELDAGLAGLAGRSVC